MSSQNRTCLCCGTKYSYCPSCSRADALKPSWFSQFCSSDCMTIWNTLTRFNMKRLDKQEAKDVINTLSLKPINKYAACVQRDLEVVMAEEPKPKRGRRVEIKPVDEEYEVVTEMIANEPAIIEE